jgi:Uma2 family endonuclease
MSSRVIDDSFEEEPMTSTAPAVVPDSATAAFQVPTGRRWTVADVAHLPEDLHYELIDGRLLLPPAPMPFRQSIGIKIAVAFEVNCPDGVFVSVDSSVMIDTHSEPRPDVLLIREEGASRTPVLGTDVLLVVEIVSRSSQVTDRQDKMKLYSYGGIPDYWIIDPLAERITFAQFRLGPDGIYQKRLETDGLITVDQPWRVTLDLPDWTRRRDRLREVARPDR